MVISSLRFRFGLLRNPFGYRSQEGLVKRGETPKQKHLLTDN